MSTISTLNLLIIALAVVAVGVLAAATIEYVIRGMVDPGVTQAVRIVLGALVGLVGAERAISYTKGDGAAKGNGQKS